MNQILRSLNIKTKHGQNTIAGTCVFIWSNNNDDQSVDEMFERKAGHKRFATVL